MEQHESLDLNNFDTDEAENSLPAKIQSANSKSLVIGEASKIIFKLTRKGGKKTHLPKPVLWKFTELLLTLMKIVLGEEQGFLKYLI